MVENRSEPLYISVLFHLLLLRDSPRLVTLRDNTAVLCNVKAM